MVKTVKQNCLRQLELWLREQQDIPGCLLLSTIPLPLYSVFVLLPYLDQQQQSPSIFHQDLALISQLFMCAVIGICIAIAVFCWRRRMSTDDFPWLSAMTVYVVFSGAIVVSVGYGYRDSPLMLLCLGLLIMIRFLFKPGLYKSAFIIAALLFVGNEIGFWTGSTTYAPILITPIFESGNLTPWWAVWLRVIYAMIAVPMVLLFILLGYLMQSEKEELNRLLVTDELTGLASRAFVLQQLQMEIRRHRRSAMPLCLLMCDVDHFKQVNDRWGHAAGDEVLRTVAEVLKRTTRTDLDLAARFGGEEFLILLPQTELNQANIIAEKIRLHLSHHIFGEAEDSYQVTMSIGVAQVTNGDGEKAIKQADKYLYHAKEQGRNRVVSAPARKSTHLSTV